MGSTRLTCNSPNLGDILVAHVTCRRKWNVIGYGNSTHLYSAVLNNKNDKYSQDSSIYGICTLLVGTLTLLSSPSLPFNT